jgi:peptidoglycan hydrolase CwlO-like protein
MTVTIKEYADKRRISVQSVYQKIKRHRAELKSHILKIGGRLELDEVAVLILDGEYPNEFYKKKNQDFEIRELEEEIRILKKELQKKDKDIEKARNDRHFWWVQCERLRKESDVKDKEIEELKNKLWKYEGTFIRRLFK